MALQVTNLHLDDKEIVQINRFVAIYNCKIKVKANSNFERANDIY